LKVLITTVINQNCNSRLLNENALIFPVRIPYTSLYSLYNIQATRHFLRLLDKEERIGSHKKHAWGDNKYLKNSGWEQSREYSTSKT